MIDFKRFTKSAFDQLEINTIKNHSLSRFLGQTDLPDAPQTPLRRSPSDKQIKQIKRLKQIKPTYSITTNFPLPSRSSADLASQTYSPGSISASEILWLDCPATSWCCLTC